MTPLSVHISDAELIDYIDRWAALLEREDYESAYALTDHTGFTPSLIREAVRRHGERVTLAGVVTLGLQVKEVTRWPTKPDGSCGDIWYDLYIDGESSDLTALFELRPANGGVTLHLIDISVR